MENKIRDIIQNIEVYNPVIFIGKSVIKFKSIYNGKIKRVSNIDDVREVVSYYINIDNLDYTLVLDGLSFLEDKSLFILLKLVEESDFSIILLSRFDKVSPILLSRIKTVFKRRREDVNSEFLSIKEGREVLREKLDDNSSYFDRLKYISEFSPKIYYYERMISKNRSKKKIKDILF